MKTRTVLMMVTILFFLFVQVVSAGENENKPIVEYTEDGGVILNLTMEDYRALAEIERMVDSGELQHVILDGRRMAVLGEAMDAFGLENGQTVSHVLYQGIVEYYLNEIVAKKAENVRIGEDK